MGESILVSSFLINNLRFYILTDLNSILWVSINDKY